MGHVSLGPRFHPGRSDFPSPVGDPSISLRCLPWCAEAQVLARIHPSLTQVCSAARQQRGGNRTVRSQCPVPPPRPSPLGAESPFAPSRRYLGEDGIECRLEERYPFFVAHTGSCVRPKPSHRLEFPSPMGLCRLLPAPAGRWPIPTLSLDSLCRCLDPYPAMSSWCTRPFLPRRRRLHVWWHAFRTSLVPGNAASAGEPISRLQSFAYVQAPTLAQPPGCTHRKTELRSRAARPYTPRRTRLVTCPEQWHRYVPVFGQLVRLDFHQLKFSLVGCSATIRLLR